MSHLPTRSRWLWYSVSRPKMVGLPNSRILSFPYRMLTINLLCLHNYSQRPLQKSVKIPLPKTHRQATGANTARCSDLDLCTSWPFSSSSTLVLRSPLEVSHTRTPSFVPLTRRSILLGWIVTYVINLRGGGPSSGYISSGFFGGTLTFFYVFAFI